jgi:UDP-GlcNAc3NAcA epimerase
MKIATIIGARPQFIKAAVVSRELRKLRGTEEILVHTGQHYDANMSEIFFRELEIPYPDYNLNIGSVTHGAQTGRMLEAIEKVLLTAKPDWVQVYGDTNSTLAGALAAAKLHIPVAHVEAGLRSYNRRMPEEVNRVLTDHVAEILFAPTQVAVDNLLKEGLPPERIKRVGDVMYDAALFYGSKAERESHILDRLLLAPKGYLLATVHRAENTDDAFRLQAIFDGLAEVGRDIPVILPLHPRTRAALVNCGLLENYHNIKLIDPVGYLDMVMLEKNAQLIATDSGGVQKEAFFYRVPCVTLREETEWTELLESGWNRLAPLTDAQGVATIIRQALGQRGREGNPYGEGKTSVNVVNILANYDGALSNN